MSRCLHHNEFGCVAQCPGRCCLHLYFGNVALRLSPPELLAWRDLVGDLAEQQVPRCADPAARCHCLPSGQASLRYVVSLEELFLLHDLLASAALLLEVDAILAA